MYMYMCMYIHVCTCHTLFFRPQYFKLIDKCVSQVVLHRTGLDPDFHYTQKFILDVDSIIGKNMSSRGGTQEYTCTSSLTDY